MSVRERAFAKLNLVLHVGRRRDDGMHPVCSIFASLDLADDVELAEAEADRVDCPGVEGPNLAAAALCTMRERLPSLPAMHVRIDKQIPVAAGLGGGSADAAAVLRAANRLAGDPLDAGELRELGAALGSDVPSQVEPRHALVQGVGELVEPLELPPLAVVLVPQRDGLATAAVYAQLDRSGGGRAALDATRLQSLAAGGADALARGLENDLEPATLALRPELGGVLDALRAAGAEGALVSGSGPTCFGLFADRRAARTAGDAIEGAIVAELRSA